ncbi:hypothetical protein FEM48_Zijuj05G0073500 [Ziziphus jujuba var. spinosa]|uniref:Uncharacterized protein n=1 Tax=Ziziphus jujuba var. spinosa TaxID=714518 RepID=A0A978VDL1_ZIZJJ|nr:hypothetical protein FEM48_Zijuj05G0073500 [Ziziphus jujuba var. spinosa]
MSKLMSSETDEHEQYRLNRDAMKKFSIRFAKTSMVGGLCFGMFSAAFYGLQNLIAATLGLLCWVQQKLEEKTEEEILAPYTTIPDERIEKKSGSFSDGSRK